MMTNIQKFALIVIVSALSLGGCGGPEDRASAYIDKAQQLFGERNFVKARLEVRNALQIQEDNTEAWLLMARIQEYLKDYQGAFNTYGQVLTLDESNLDALAGRGRIYLAARRFEEAEVDLRNAQLIDPNDSGVLLLEAGLAAANKDEQRAIELATRSLGADPASYRARIFLALLHSQKGLDEEAASLLHDGLESSPESVELWQALVVLYRKAGEEEKEIGALQKLVELEPDEIARLHRLSGSLAVKGRTDDAEALLRERLKEYPDDSETALLLANLMISTDSDPVQQETKLKLLISEYPAVTDLRFHLVKFYISRQNATNAEQELESLIDEFSLKADGIKARKQLAGILLASGKRERSSELIAEVLQENPRDGDALIARSALSLVDQNTDDAIADLRVVLADRPASEKASNLIVRAYLAKGAVDQAADQLARFIDNAPVERGAYLALTQLYSRLGRVDDAERVLKKMVSVMPGDVFGLRNLSQLASQKGDPVLALEYAERLRDKHPEMAEGHYAVGSVYQSSGAHGDAIDAFHAALEIKPDAIEPLTALVRSRIAMGQAEQALAELDDAVRKNQDHFVAHNLIGELLHRRQLSEEALQRFSKASGINPGWVVPYINSARLLNERGDVAKGIAVLEDAKNKTASNPLIVRQLAALYEKNGQTGAAIREYEDILESSPETVDAANNLAVLLSQREGEHQDLDRAYSLAQRFAQSDNPLYRNTLGWVLFQRGAVEEALPHLEYAVRTDETRGELQFHLGAAYARLGRKTDAKIHGVISEQNANDLLRQARGSAESTPEPPPLADPDMQMTTEQGSQMAYAIEEMKREREALASDLEKLKQERQAISEQLQQSAVDQELLQNRNRKLIEREVQRQVEEALAKKSKESEGDVRVRYVPDFLLADIREQVKAELKEEVKTEIVEGVYEQQGEEGLPIPEVPEWTGRLSLGGDFRLRYQHDSISSDSGAWYDYNTINDNGRFSRPNEDPGGDLLSRTNEDRDRLRGRFRLGIDTKLGYDFNAGARISTGNTGDPVSTNQTLGTGLNRYEVVLDRAYLGYAWNSDSGNWGIKATGGRMPNPFYSTDLLWDGDLGFEGVSTQLSYKQQRPQKLFGIGTRGYETKATVGAFPLEEFAFTSRDKWLYGAQLEANITLLDRKKLHFGVAYYTYDNITGVADDRPAFLDPSRDADIDASLPKSVQKGNTLFDVYSAPGSSGFDAFGLASDFDILNLSLGVEIPDFRPYHIWLTADYVKNLAWDESEVLSRIGGVGVGTTNPLDGKHDTGYMFRAEVGSPWMLDEGDWRLYAAYKYIEPDAVLDAFNDSDFMLGGTNAKGFILGGKYVLQRDVVLAFRYLNGESIVNPLDPNEPGSPELAPLKSATYQLDINAKF